MRRSRRMGHHTPCAWGRKVKHRPWSLTSLNSPLLWWFNWRHLGHGKDEALNALGFKMEQLPIAPAADDQTFACHVNALRSIQTEAHQTRQLLADWYRHSLGVETLPTVLRDPFRLGADQFVSAIGKAPGNNRRPLTAATIGHIRDEHTRTVEPMAHRLADAVQHERALSDIVNAAYGLTREEVALMWRTAPPRMPLDPANELRRLAGISAGRTSDIAAG